MDNNDYRNEFKPHTYNKVVGSYVIGNWVMFFLPKKPNTVHRYFCKLLLGWEWKDKIMTKENPWPCL